MELEITTKIIYQVQSRNFDRWVSDRYDIDYCLQADYETGDEGALTFTVDGQIDAYDQNELDKLTTDGYFFSAKPILNQAAHVGDIPTGDYVITLVTDRAS